jgi:integrase
MASIYKTRDSRWRVQIRKMGVSDTRNFTRKTDASAWATKRERDIELGNAGLPRNATGTVGDLLREYHRVVYPLKRYSRSKVYELNKLDQDLGSLPVQALTVERITAYGLDLRQHLGGQGVMTRISYLREVLKAAHDLWHAPVPLEAIAAAVAALRRQRVTAKAPPRTRRPTDEELEWIIACHGRQRCAEVDLPAVINVLRLLPLRVGELLKIEWADLLPDRRAVRLRARKHPDVNVRESNDYTIPLPVIGGIDTWELVAGRPRFLPRPFPYARDATSSAFHYAAHSARVENLHLHDLRAFSISKLIEANVPIPMIAHMSGHKSWKLLQSTYTRLDPAQVAQAIERAAA